MVAANIEEIVSCQQLPSLPAIAIRVIELSENSNVQIPEIADVIQNDQALTAKILKTVNSSFFGLCQPCETISRAMTYLGLNTIKSLVLGFSLVRIRKEEPCSEALSRHWRRVVYAAAAARRVAQELGHCDPEEAFIAALMQDIGGLAMHVSLKGDYARVVDQAGHDHSRLPAIERRIFGFDHAAVGASLAERWNLPRSLVQIIRHHHEPQHDSRHHLLQTITLGTQFADVAAADTGTDPDCKAMLERFAACSQQWYDIDPDTAGKLVQYIIDDAAALASLFDINVGDHSDASAIMAKAEDISLMHQLRAQGETERLQQQNRTLARMARTCGLTGLANRRWFDDQLCSSVNHALANDEPLAVVFIDADHFKQLNDTLGHQAGDVVLIELAARISDVLPENALAGRYGGEEFVVMLPGKNHVDASRLAETIRTRIVDLPIDLRDVECDQPTVSVSVSLGVAAIEPQTRDVLTNLILLLKAADRALYHAKLAGRNQVQVFVPRCE